MKIKPAISVQAYAYLQKQLSSCDSEAQKLNLCELLKWHKNKNLFDSIPTLTRLENNSRFLQEVAYIQRSVNLRPFQESLTNRRK